MAAAVMSTQQRQKFKDSLRTIDLAYSVPGLGRFRCNVFQQRGTIGLVLRVIPIEHPVDRRPRAAAGAQADRGRGARPRPRHRHHRQRQERRRWRRMIDHINAHAQRSHVMTVEDPIEFLHRDNRSIVNQREVVGRHAVVRARAAQRAAPGPRRHPRRRNARLRDDRDGAARVGDRPPGVFDAAHAGRDRDDQPHHRRLPAAPAEARSACSSRAVLKAVVSQRLMPKARRQGPRRGGRGDDHHAPSSATASSTRRRRT